MNRNLAVILCGFGIVLFVAAYRVWEYGPGFPYDMLLGIAGGMAICAGLGTYIGSTTPRAQLFRKICGLGLIVVGGSLVGSAIIDLREFQLVVGAVGVAAIVLGAGLARIQQAGVLSWAFISALGVWLEHMVRQASPRFMTAYQLVFWPVFIFVLVPYLMKRYPSK